MSDGNGNRRKSFWRAAWPALLLLMAAACGGSGAPARRAGLCVSPQGQGGCFATIGAAVAAAGDGQIIYVRAGTYAEMVSISKPLTLIGNDSFSQPSVIDAAGRDHGAYVSAVSRGAVVIRDFEIRNAGREGILVANSSQVVLESIYVHGSGAASSGACAGAAPGERYGCGAGIRLRAVRQSTVLDDELVANQGGLLISDETGPSSHNLIAHNTVRANPRGCGISLSSRAPCRAGAKGAMVCGGDGAAHGIFANVISANAVESNGACGIGIFAQFPTGAASASTVSGNIIRDNAAGGVVLHGNGSVQSLRDTVISGNIISANGADPGVSTVAAGVVVIAPAPTDAHGADASAATDVGAISIGQNTITDEGVDVFVNALAGGDVNVFLNDLLGGRGVLGVRNSGARIVTAMGNYWGCAAGPGADSACSSSSGPVLTNPPLSNPVPTPIINLTGSAFLDSN